MNTATDYEDVEDFLYHKCKHLSSSVTQCYNCNKYYTFTFHINLLPTCSQYSLLIALKTSENQVFSMLTGASEGNTEKKQV